MKVIALLPVRDEAWILPAYLSSVAPVVDEIIALDDGSSDGSKELIEAAGGRVEANASQSDSVWVDHSTGGPSRHVSAWRLLLELGRSGGGTHFIYLDADEALTAPCHRNLRGALEKLESGQKLAMRWLTLWKRRDRYRDDDSVWAGLFKDFAFADLGSIDYTATEVERTPGPRNETTWRRLPQEHGAVLHYQFVPWWRSQLKQAWYRCAELIRAPRKAYDINLVYDVGLDSPEVHTSELPSAWLDGIEMPEGIEDAPPGWHLDTVLAWFDEHGVEFFEPLQIWHIPQLHRVFVDSVGREPRPLTHLSPAQRVVKAVGDRLAARRA